MARKNAAADTNSQIQTGYNPAPGATTAGYYTAAGTNTPAPAAAAAAPVGNPIPDPYNQTKTDTGGGAPAAAAAPDWYAQYMAAEAARAAAVETAARETAKAWLTNTLTSFGLGELAGDVSNLVQAWGSNTDVISLKLKETGSYRDRFAGLIALQSKGVTDVQNEAQYIQLESGYRQAFRENGLTTFLGDAGSKAEQAKIAKIVGDFSLSVNEVRDRISDAQRIAGDTPDDIKSAFRNYYGVDTTQLVEYSLDPQKTAELINRQANAAVAGGLAQRNSLGIGSTTAEQIAMNAGTGDIQQGALNSEMVNARAVRDSTRRLAQIENTDLTDSEAVGASMNLDANAAKKVDTLQSRERARFGGSSSTVKGTLSRNRGT